MAARKRVAKRLTDGYCDSVTRPGFYGDGGRGSYGLQLRVHRTKTGIITRTWIQKIRIAGKPTALGLGRYPIVTLAEARLAALQNATALHRGIDPRTGAVAAPVAVPARPVAAPAPAAVGPTFEEAAEKVIALNRAGWRHPATEARWRRDIAALSFRAMPVGAIRSGDILAAIAPVWTSKPTVAKHRLRIVGAVLKWAVAGGYRADDPTAAVRAGLPRQRATVAHHRAVSPADIGAVVRKIRRAKTRRENRLALEFCILTAARSGEVAGMTFGECDLEAGCWRIPGDRMKSGREHRVPLSKAARAVIRQAGPSASDDLVFPSTKGTPITRASFRAALKRAGVDTTTHGFRSTFRDWCGEQGIDRTLAELCLAHRIGDATEQAYARADLLERRREVMEVWGRHVDG